MNQTLLDYAARSVPRYTSYPTAPHFSGDVGHGTYARWLTDLPPEARLSVYLHVPYCRTMCHYCGCHTKAVLRPEPVSAYARTLEREIDLVGQHLGAADRRPLSHIHWGGGTPSLLDHADFSAIVKRLTALFDLEPDAEHAIELDPRTVTGDLVETLVACGVNRASLGVQDFNPHVQQAIGRVQDEALVRSVVDSLRTAGIDAINMDLMYGLPHQGVDDVIGSVDAAVRMAPSRIALFGYAHVPWMKKHQRLIDSAALPGAMERLRQAEAAADRLVARGYVAIGIDHFALPDDPLAIAAADGTLRRNFQGYTTDPADALIGLGASSIGRMPQGYSQNAPDIGGWRRAVEAGTLPVVRGRALDDDDRARADIIERLMCDFAVDAEAIFMRYRLPVAALEDADTILAPLIRDGLAERDGAILRIPPAMRSYARLVASAFDAYLQNGVGRHSVAV